MSNMYECKHPLMAHKLAKLRSVATKPKQFRELIREISMLLTYEATTDLVSERIIVKTPLGESMGQVLTDKIGLVPILRAGLGMVEGIWQMIPTAEVWHIGLQRDEKTLQPLEYYSNLPDNPTVHMCLVLDPMLATGGSAIATVDLIKEWGVSQIKYLTVIAAHEGIENLNTHHPDVPIHIGGIDSHLNDTGFIVPGLGDAGDRQFGTG